MSRVDELKKQYPQLNMSLFDLISRIDPTKSHKYLALLCKIFAKKFDVFEQNPDKVQRSELILSLNSQLISKGISTNKLSENQLWVLGYFSDFWGNDFYSTVVEFIEYSESNKLENKDVTSYRNLDDLRNAITVASLKEISKELEKQIIKEYEDDKWVILRPLTFSASAKYGASTRWCTTYRKEKQYFEKYWRQGILVYFINKLTGYKFACYKSLEDSSEISFWNAEDQRVDFLTLQFDDYLLPVVRKILSSEFTNKNLCSDEIQDQVHSECLHPVEHRLSENIPIEFVNDFITVDEDTERAVFQRLREAAREYGETAENIPIVRMNTFGLPERG